MMELDTRWCNHYKRYHAGTTDIAIPIDRTYYIYQWWLVANQKMHVKWQTTQATNNMHGKDTMK